MDSVAEATSVGDLDDVLLPASTDPADPLETEGGKPLLVFEEPTDEAKFGWMLQKLLWCMLLYLCTTAITICSSNYTAHPSHLDTVLLASDILTIDICSCFFVMGGFLATYVYSSVGAESWFSLRRHVMAQQLGNIWMSTLCILIFGSIDKLVKARFQVSDVMLTVLEGVTALRLFDSHQSLEAPHTFNVALWPVQSFVWCLLSVHGTYRTNEVLRSRFGDVANYVILCMALCGICLFTLFGMLHSRTNVFYANATSIMYRMLEFNLGIHFFYLTERNYVLVVSLARILGQCSPVVYFLFAATWWSEIGVVVTETIPICLRLYPRNNCLHDHHAFLLRGCIMGLTMLSQISSEGAVSVTRLLTYAQAMSTAVAFSWPAYVFIHLVFVITFSEALVYENAALVSVMMPCFVILGSFVYTFGIQHIVTDVVQDVMMRAEDHAQRLYTAVCGSVLAAEADDAGVSRV